MTEFKVGDIVIKARRWNSEKYCEHGGDEDEVPLGTQGIIKSVCDYKAVVKFVNGKEWSVNISELDLVTKKVTQEKMTDIKKFDKKAISEAITEIDEERLKLQTEKAKDILREIHSRKDTAEESKEKLSDELKDIGKELNTFIKASK